MPHVPVVVVGAGHCGLATSRHLADRSIDHVVLERGEVAQVRRVLLLEAGGDLGETGVARDERRRAGGGGLGRDHPERLREDRRDDRRVGEREQVDEVTVLERPREEHALREPRVSGLPLEPHLAGELIASEVEVKTGRRESFADVPAALAAAARQAVVARWSWAGVAERLLLPFR